MQNFDLKYRPRRFSEILGNQGVVRLLLKLSREGRLAGRSIMFGGPKGCGKTSLARIVARAIVCDELTDGEPCGECYSCLSVMSESSDSFEEFDAATQGTVERIRSIVDGLEYGNLSGKPFVLIMDEAHRLSKQAQDALLKSVEDRRLVIILCTTEPHKIQGAIRSRVIEFPVVAPSESEMVGRMEAICKQESISFEPGSLELIVKSLGSCPRTCFTTLELLSPSLTVDLVKSHFKYSSLESIASVLAKIDSSPADALAELDSLIASEGPTWVRDNIILAISSALRVSVGARPTFPASHTFFESRGREWSRLAAALGSMDRPSASDIEAAIMSECRAPGLARISSPQVVSSPDPSPVSASAPAPTPAPTPAPAPAPAPVLSMAASPPFERPSAPLTPKPPIEVDGIRFTHEENLTSLDSKIDRSPHHTPSHYPDVKLANVEFDTSRVPIPEKEFSRGLIQRLKKTK